MSAVGACTSWNPELEDGWEHGEIIRVNGSRLAIVSSVSNAVLSLAQEDHSVPGSTGGEEDAEVPDSQEPSTTRTKKSKLLKAGTHVRFHRQVRVEPISVCHFETSLLDRQIYLHAPVAVWT